LVEGTAKSAINDSNIINDEKIAIIEAAKIVALETIHISFDDVIFIEKVATHIVRKIEEIDIAKRNELAEKIAEKIANIIANIIGIEEDKSLIKIQSFKDELKNATVQKLLIALPPVLPVLPLLTNDQLQQVHNAVVQAVKILPIDIQGNVILNNEKLKQKYKDIRFQ
jgi:hypothetical protein